MSRESYDPALARALDAFETPPLSPGFAARVADAAKAAAPRPPVARRDRRGRWTRGRSAALGLVAAGLMSATAAAAGLFGDLGVTVPALERVVARIADTPELAPPPRTAPRREIVRTETPEPAADPSSAVEAEVPIVSAPALREVRREVVAQRLATRVERRIARRERLGLPVDPRLKDPDTPLDPATAARFPERAALVERVQQIRRERREGDTVGAEAELPVEGDITEPAPRDGAEAPVDRLRDLPPEARAEALRRWRAMTPAERAERLRRIREVRQRSRRLN